MAASKVTEKTETIEKTESLATMTTTEKTDTCLVQNTSSDFFGVKRKIEQKSEKKITAAAAKKNNNKNKTKKLKK